MRRYAVLGTGAIGGYYGARLAAAGHDVHFLGRADVAHLRAHGLRVQSVDGDIELPDVSAHAEPGTVPAVDVVLVALKTTANGALPELLPPLLGTDTTVVLLQNGLGVEDAVAPLVGERALLGGLCFVAASRVGPGHVEHLGQGTITLGQHGTIGVTPAVDAVAADFEAAGIPMQREPDLAAGRWRKLVWNVPFNGLSVVLGALPGELLADPDAAALVQAFMVEVQQGAAACGRPIPDAFLQQMLDLTAGIPHHRTSMYLDHQAGRPLEVEAMFAAPVAAAATQGVDLPRLAVLRDQVRFLDPARRPPGPPPPRSE